MTATLTNADPAATKMNHAAGTPEQAVGRALAIVLGLLTIFGPISMDLYLPVLPALTIELKSAAASRTSSPRRCARSAPPSRPSSSPGSSRASPAPSTS